MKSISAAIMFFAGVCMCTQDSRHWNPHSEDFYFFVGCLVSLIAFGVWVWTLIREGSPSAPVRKVVPGSKPLPGLED